MATELPLESLEPEQPPSIPLSSNNLYLVPYAQLDGEWNIGEHDVLKVYFKALEQGLIETVFWDGSLPDERSFLRMCQNPHNVVAFAVDEQLTSVGFAWLSSMTGSYAFAHFCLFKDIWGGGAEELGKLYLDYWFSLSGEEPLFDTILGAIPGFNRLAQNYVERIGFQHLGKIPNMLKGENRKEDAIIFYRSRDGQE